jgi:hypothetical protein
MYTKYLYIVTQFEKIKNRFKFFYGKRDGQTITFFCELYNLQVMDTVVRHNLQTVNKK